MSSSTIRRLVPASFAIAAVLAGNAFAAAPLATTTAATDVTSTTAVVNGTVEPNGEDTTYVFQYGTTTDYGTTTPVQGPVKGNGARAVSATLSGLAPGTTYHYRVVATNPSGTVNGADMTFTTAAPGSAPGVTISSSKPAVTFGRPVTITGTVTGPGNAGATVTLEGSETPTSTTFKSTGLTATTDAAGAFSIVVKPTQITRYRVTVGKGKDVTTSNEVTVKVRAKVNLSVSDRTPRSGQRVFFTGSVLPGHEGVIAKIQRRTAKGWRTVATTALIAASPLADGTTRSTYSKGVRVRSDGTYRVRVAPGDGDHVTGISRKRSVDVA